MEGGDHTYDVIVIGAGPAGEVAAGRLAEHGKSVAIVERHLVGGECSYYACIPSKALLRPPDLLAEAARVPGAAEVTGSSVDVAAVLARRDELIGNLDDSGQLPWLENHGIKVVRGVGHFTGEREVTVDQAVLRANDAVVIATGSSAAVPPALASVDPWTNRQVTTAPRVPARLVIVGGGVVAVEMADAYASLGAQVTLVVRDERLVAREEEFAGDLVGKALKDKGVALHFSVNVTSAERSDAVTLTLDDGSELVADEVLSATGRIPNSVDLELGSIGIELDERGYVRTDDQLRVPGTHWLYAIGDVNGRNLLTHEGKYQGRIVGDLIGGLSGTTLRSQDSPPTRVIFTDPQVAAIGHTTGSAAAADLHVDVHDIDLESTAGSSYIGRGAGGRVRMLVDPKRDVIAGMTLVGPEVSEMLHAATIAVVGEVPLDVLMHCVPAFPTRNEIWLGLLEAAGY